MVVSATRVVLMLALAGLSGAFSSAELARSNSNWPQGYSFLTLHSGRTYKLLNSGPVIGEGSKRLGMGVSYISSARTFAQLKEAAQDLFEYIRPLAEQQHDELVVVMAKLGLDRHSLANQSITYGIIYERQASGRWQLHDVDESKPLPSVEPAADDAGSPDLQAESMAKADAKAWLALMDASKFEESWDAAAPYLKLVTTKTDWVSSGKRIRSLLGELVSRMNVSTVATATVPSAPVGRYVVVEFQAKYSNRQVAFENVVEMLCADGKWRVAGYDVR